MKTFTASVSVRVGDINYGGHLGHDSLITLLHQARVDFLQYLGASELDCFGTGLIMRRLEVDYLGEAFLGDVLQVEMHIAALRPSRFSISYTAAAGGRTIAKAMTVMVAFDYQARQVAPLSDAFRAAAEEYVHG